jgi:hypothetical protein
MLPTLKPSNMKNNSLIKTGANALGNLVDSVTGNNNQPSNPNITEYVTQSQQTAKTLASAVGMQLNDFAKLNGISPSSIVKAKTVVKVPSNLAFKTAYLVPKKQ